MFEKTDGAANEFRPILQPFVNMTIPFDSTGFRMLVRWIVKRIYEEVSVSCNINSTNLGTLSDFISELRDEFVTRIYTTNYDDVLISATNNLYTGFNSAQSSDYQTFNSKEFWQKSDIDSVFHLHGSLHFGFDPLDQPTSEINGIVWFNEVSKAIVSLGSSGSGTSQMDGTQNVNAPIITGLDKLSRIQINPFSHYYASFARDAMMADVIFVIGCGMYDLHLNSWLGEARRKDSKPPLIYIGKWKKRFLEATAFEIDFLTTRMFHTLCMHIDAPSDGYEKAGWTFDNNQTCAIWDGGFSSFLNQSDRLGVVRKELGI